ncbi:MAG: efflux RND transporter permease subunit, partial [Acidobacteriota bacterium]
MARDLLVMMLTRRRLILTSALLLALTGLGAWLTMPREEDPQFPERDGLVLVAFPGADAKAVERLVVEPLEEHLAEVEELAVIESVARTGVAVVRLELQQTIYATDEAWDEVKDAVEDARAEFPDGVLPPRVEDDLIGQDAIVLAITGAPDPLVLATAAERLKSALIGLPQVRKINIFGDPGDQITIAYDDATARRLALDPRQLGAQLGARSQIVPGGVIHLGSKTASLRPETEFSSVDEIARTPIVLPSGAAVPLSALAEVRRGPAEPATERMRWNGEIAVAVGVVPKDNINRITLGDAVRARVAELAPTLEPMQIEEVFFQPKVVAERLDELGRSLMLGILIVAAILFLTMGLRLGFVVAVVVPLVTYAALAMFALSGGVLNQISIAALVIALGMLVDNAIVMTENIQWRLDRGAAPTAASADAVRELGLPLGSATGTTLAAFVPMLISKGPTADFTRSIPTLIMLTLAISYVFAVLVTPVLGELVLRARGRSAGAADADDEAAADAVAAGRLGRVAHVITRLGVGRPWLVLAGALVLLSLTAVAAGQVEQQFFPGADRPNVVVTVTLPEGTHLEATDRAVRTLEQMLATRPETANVVSFMGRGAPRFFYNLRPTRESPHRAQIVVETARIADVGPMMEVIRTEGAALLPEAEIVVKRLQQGPPITAPIEVKLYGDDLGDLAAAADAVLAETRATPGTRDVVYDLDLGAPTVRFTIDDGAAGRLGLSRADVALALLGRTLGLEIGQFRVADDPVPILVRSQAGERFPVDDLAAIDVAVPGGAPVPLAQVASIDARWRPAAIERDGRQRVVRVQSQLAEGVTYTAVLDQLQPRLTELALPAGVRLVYAGEAAESADANAAILSGLPIGALLLLFFLLIQFNSFRRIGVILVTVPLAVVGVVPGLLLANQPFGFMSLLGVLSLVGIVVNNAIVMVDVIEQRRRAGARVPEAVTTAVQRRIRPILLTMATTVAGLSPLAFSDTSLWPPLAWSMISGLIASTALTLLVAPALYVVLFRHQDAALPASDDAPAARPTTARPLPAALLAVVGGGLQLARLGARRTRRRDGG